VPSLAIYNPGVIKGRNGAGTSVGEKVLGWIPFVPSIQSDDLGLAILINAIATSQREQASSDEPSKVIFTTNQIKEIAAKAKKEESPPSENFISFTNSNSHCCF